jgi:hypothetical protein
MCILECPCGSAVSCFKESIYTLTGHVSCIRIDEVKADDISRSWKRNLLPGSSTIG